MQHRFHDMPLEIHGEDVPASIRFICDGTGVSLVNVAIKVNDEDYYLPEFMVSLLNANEYVTDALEQAAKREDWSNNIKRRVA